MTVGPLKADEPLSNLDAKLRVEMRAKIKLLHQRTQTTTVYATHDQVEAMTLGDRIAVMKLCGAGSAGQAQHDRAHRPPKPTPGWTRLLAN
jgi:ABC-type sugar transport system ATPase subunit